jgi:O-antigen/teichoic acid export membrane protein
VTDYSEVLDAVTPGRDFPDIQPPLQRDGRASTQTPSAAPAASAVVTSIAPATGPADRQGRRTVRMFVVRRYAGDHLVRTSLFNISATVVTSLLGFTYWFVAARIAPASTVGYASALMSAATAASLLTYLGVGGLVVEQLPRFERTGEWPSFLSRWIWVTALASAAAATMFALVVDRTLVDAVGAAWVTPLLALCTACLTTLGILDRAFTSARRADLGLLLAALLAVGKVASLGALALAAAGLGVMLGGWAVALVVTSAIGMLLVAPRVGHGRLGWPKAPPPVRAELVRVLGHHVTSVGGIMTPYILPIIVLARLDAASNAYFYSSWMIGSVFFIISPAVASSLFAEGSRVGGSLTDRTRRALRLLALLLPLPIVLGVLAGPLVLALFGDAYAAHGYALLVVLAVSALPDAFTNVAVAVLRIKGHLRRSSALNTGMGVVALVGAWALLPAWGLVAAGIAWLTAQVLGSLAVAPMMVGVLRGVPAQQRA